MTFHSNSKIFSSTALIRFTIQSPHIVSLCEFLNKLLDFCRLQTAVGSSLFCALLYSVPLRSGSTQSFQSFCCPEANLISQCAEKPHRIFAALSLCGWSSLKSIKSHLKIRFHYSFNVIRLWAPMLTLWFVRIALIPELGWYNYWSRMKEC
jgi:hypothetical protein